MRDSILEIRSLFAGYGSEPVLKDLSLSLNRGARVIVCGPNGSGKTTLLKCILGIIKPVSGTIKLSEGCSIAYCKQDFPKLDFPITAREVVEMGRNRRNHQAVQGAMSRTGTLELSDRLFWSLSGGERQRVSLARCYCQNADLLLLDEPSSFLDTQSREDFISMMKNMADPKLSVIAVTHDDQIVSSLGWDVVHLSKRVL